MLHPQSNSFFKANSVNYSSKFLLLEILKSCCCWVQTHLRGIGASSQLGSRGCLAMLAGEPVPCLGHRKGIQTRISQIWAVTCAPQELSSPTSYGLKAGENNLPRENLSTCQVGSWQMGSPPRGPSSSALSWVCRLKRWPGNPWYIVLDGQAASGSERPRSAEPDSCNEPLACKRRESSRGQPSWCRCCHHSHCPEQSRG